MKIESMQARLDAMHGTVQSQTETNRALLAKLEETAKVRDEWCAEFVRCRDALRKIAALCDRATIDGGTNYGLLNQIENIVLETINRKGVEAAKEKP